MKENRITLKDLRAWCNISFADRYANPLDFYATKFYLNNAEIKDLIVPEGVEKILPYAFCGCRSIERVAIPAEVVSIGDYAFDDCDSMESISLSSGLLSIGAYAFTCSARYLTIPASVSSVGENAFGASTWYVSFDGVPPEGVESAGFYQSYTPTIRYNVAHEEEWLAVINVNGFGGTSSYVKTSSITYENLLGVSHDNPATYQEGQELVFSDPNEKTGYRFCNWIPAAITSETIGDIVVRANWTTNHYSIHFDANGGTGSMPDQKYVYDVGQPIKTNAFARPGYKFVGWMAEKTCGTTGRWLQI